MRLAVKEHWKFNKGPAAGQRGPWYQDGQFDSAIGKYFFDGKPLYYCMIAFEPPCYMLGSCQWHVPCLFSIMFASPHAQANQAVVMLVACKLAEHATTRCLLLQRVDLEPQSALSRMFTQRVSVLKVGVAIT